MPEQSDRHLVLRTLAGENEAYGTLVREYQQSVFNVCYRMLGEYGQAEDMAQNTFIRAHQRLSTFDINRPFGPWIRRVATNLCLNQLKRILPEITPLEDEILLSSSHPSTNPERAQEELERNQAIRQAMLELPPHYLAVIELRHFQDMNYQEIADTLKLPVNTAKSHLFRARKLLAKKLEKNHELE
jgi:RNA polymerase sigma-70 factor, ECF subfamily